MTNNNNNASGEWQGSPWPKAPDEFWEDDYTRELVCATTGVRLPSRYRYYPADAARAALKARRDGVA